MRKVVVAAVVVAAGCGSAEQARESEPARVRPSTTVERSTVAAKTCEKGETRRLGNRRVAYAAAANGKTVAYARPGGKRLHVFPKTNKIGLTTIFGVSGSVLGKNCDPAWYRVGLPMRPNGAKGYVRASAVTLYSVRTRIEIDVSARRLQFFRDGRRVLRAAIAVGSSETPTPLGRYYVNQRVRSLDPSGPYGPAALGISAFSPVLTGWTEGGPIAIHGTNAPWSIGKAISNGCMRLPNKTLRRVYRATPAGTPVVIRA